MKAMVISQSGGPQVLQWSDVPDPACGPGEVVIDVAATAVNRADLLQRQGFYPPPPGAPEWPGLECSGVISAVGADVDQWTTGEEVCALLAGGGYAERVAVPAGQVFPRPASVDLVDAAALPEVASTVWSNVFMAAGLRRDEVLLVHGGASGVGTMAIQLATQLGAQVAVTAGSAEKLGRCAELGAQILINHRDDDFVERLKAETGGAGADVVLDNMGAMYLNRNLRVLATGGRLIVIGMQGGTKAELDLGLLMSRRGAIISTSLRARPVSEKSAIVESVTEYVWPLLNAGVVKPVIHTRMPLADAAAAHQLMEDSEHVGKILLTL